MNRQWETHDAEAPVAEDMNGIEEAFQQAAKMRAIARENAEGLLRQRDQYNQLAAECQAAADIWKTIAHVDVESAMERDGVDITEDVKKPEPRRRTKTRV